MLFCRCHENGLVLIHSCINQSIIILVLWLVSLRTPYPQSATKRNLRGGWERALDGWSHVSNELVKSPRRLKKDRETEEEVEKKGPPYSYVLATFFSPEAPPWIETNAKYREVIDRFNHLGSATRSNAPRMIRVIGGTKGGLAVNYSDDSLHSVGSGFDTWLSITATQDKGL